MTSKALQQRLSINLKTLRKGKFTQETLAEAAGISSQMVNNIEGCRRWPSETTLVKIADALNIDVQQLFAPAIDESILTSTIYTAVTEKVVSRVRFAVDEVLENFKWR